MAYWTVYILFYLIIIVLKRLKSIFTLLHIEKTFRWSEKHLYILNTNHRSLVNNKKKKDFYIKVI